jgi:hypothetical protein
MCRCPPRINDTGTSRREQARFRPLRQKLCSWLVPVLLLISSATASADEAQSIEQFLSRLGLIELRLVHIERMLARETAADKRQAMARKLADAYAEELVAAADEPERFAQLKTRVEKLLASTPEARTPGVEVVLLQAEYQRAEALVVQWLEEPANRTPLEEAGQILTRVQPLLAARQLELAAAAETAADEIDKLKTEPERQAAEQQLKRQQAVAARADYFAGWAAYYLGVAQRVDQRATESFQAAKQHFSRVLDVTDDDNYAPIEAQSLGLDSIWRSRAVIGLGLSELGLNRLPAAARVFGWLSHASVSPTIRDQAGYWHIQGMLNVGRHGEAAKLIAREVETLTTNPSAGKSSLCVAAIRTGAALGDERRDERQQLIDQGIRGLARMRQFDTLQGLIEKHKLDEGPLKDSFHLAWLRGRRQYLESEKDKQPERFRAAARTLSAALALPQARNDLLEAGQARYYLAWARFRLEELDAAARLFNEAAMAMRSAAPEVAVQAAWMHATCLVQLAAKDKRQIAPAIAALQSFKQEFPSSEEASKVDPIVTRLRQSHAAPEEVIRELAAVKPGDPSYLSAQYELSQLRYQLWSKSKALRAQGDRLAVELLATVDRFLAAADKSSDGQRRLKAALLAIDVLQSSPNPDPSQVSSLLASVAKAADELEPKNPTASEYQYRRLQHAQKSGDSDTASAAANWIARHGAGSPYELPALVVVARMADEAVTRAAPGERPSAIAEAWQVYSRLVALLGESADALRNNKNALAAASKLAQYDEQQASWPAAAERLARLVEAVPRDRRLLRRAGLAAYNAGQFAQALEHWRTLLGGLEGGSDEWLEAKYFQLACLIETDRATADKVFKQFKVLYPDVKSAAWREKFAELESRL